MKLKRPTIAVPADQPFQHDQLGRERYARVLTDFVKTLEDPFVLAIESDWGHGKTTFVRMWSQQLANEGHTCLYFNAWENDFAEDPLVSLIGAISSALQVALPKTAPLSAHFEKLKQVGAQVAKRSIPVAAKLLTAGVLDLDSFTEKSYAEAVEGLIKEKFDDYESEKQSLEEFRKTLSKLINALQTNGHNLPLVFFVDELDRCKPPYAVAAKQRL